MWLPAGESGDRRSRSRPQHLQRSAPSHFSKDAPSFSSLGHGHMAFSHCCSMSRSSRRSFASIVPQRDKARYGVERVVASDLKQFSQAEGVYERLDCTQPQMIADVMRRHDIGAVYRLAALLSAVAEQRPQSAAVEQYSRICRADRVRLDAIRPLRRPGAASTSFQPDR